MHFLEEVFERTACTHLWCGQRLLAQVSFVYAQCPGALACTCELCGVVGVARAPHIHSRHQGALRGRVGKCHLESVIPHGHGLGELLVLFLSPAPRKAWRTDA